VTTPPPALTLPVGRRAARGVVLASVFVCAASGLVYELALVTLGSYLIGDSVEQTSVVLSVMVCAMGVGSLLAKPLTTRPLHAFATVELLLGVLGGLSVMGLYAAFAFLDLYTPALVATSVVVGVLIGAELPLLMTLIQRIRRQEAGQAVADLFAADYVGALAGGLAFPFLLLPAFGQIQGALAAGAVNLVAAAVVVGWLFGHDLRRPTRLVLTTALLAALALLGVAAWRAAAFEVSARQALFADPIVTAVRSPYQQIVLTRSSSPEDLRLFLNGDLQFSSVDEYRYHEALVHPAMAGPHARVLVLGGGDGLAARELLRYRDVREITLVDLDAAVTRLARTDPRLVTLNQGSLTSGRVRVVNADAFTWLRSAAASAGPRFDVVVADLPDPDSAATAKLYSAEFYRMAAAVLTPQGRAVVQAGSPYFAPEAFWSVGETLRAAGLTPTPYQVDVPSFGNWGFHLAAPGAAPPLRLPAPPPPGLRFLDAPTLQAAAVFPKDRRPQDVEPSTLMHPRIVDYHRKGWQTY
jgi:spermidine synthase